jgi:Rho GDP-dissociation inhibitor
VRRRIANIQGDESLQRWKASLGLAGGPGSGAGPKRVSSRTPLIDEADIQVVMKTLFLSSPTLKDRIVIDLKQSPAQLAETKKNPSMQLIATLHSHS